MAKVSIVENLLLDRMFDLCSLEGRREGGDLASRRRRTPALHYTNSTGEAGASAWMDWKPRGIGTVAWTGGDAFCMVNFAHSGAEYCNNALLEDGSTR
jgi:hypothetical protein